MQISLKFLNQVTSYLKITDLQMCWKDGATCEYRQVSNIRLTSAGNKFVDHSDVVEASPVGAAPTTSSFSTKLPGINSLCKYNCKTRRGTFKFGDLVRLILEILR